MDFIGILGKKITETPLTVAEYEMEYNNRGADEGIEHSWYVVSRDGSFEMRLDSNKVIHTIFIKPVTGVFPGFDFTSNTTREEIKKKMGIPSKSGDEKVIGGLGRYGGFDRYDAANFSIHFQYTPGRVILEMITLMVPEVSRAIG